MPGGGVRTPSPTFRFEERHVVSLRRSHWRCKLTRVQPPIKRGESCVSYHPCRAMIAEFSLRLPTFRVIMLAWANDARRASAPCNFYFSMI